MSESSDKVIDQMEPLCDMPLRKLDKIVKRPPIDVEFQNLEYSVRDRNGKNGKLSDNLFIMRINIFKEHVI